MTALAPRVARLEAERVRPAAPPPLDPVALAERAGLVLDDWQRQAVTSTSMRIALCCSRQSGKSTVAALKAIHVAVYEPGSLVLLLSRALRQSQELFRTAMAIYRTLGRPVAAEAESRLRLELENGSRLVSLPGTEETTRGFARVRLLCVDEASRVPDSTYYSLRPTLAIGQGQLMTLSTPWGARGWWHAAWQHGGETWERYRVTAEECPRISSTFLAEEAETLGEYWYQQEYCCAFLDSQTAAFGHEVIDRAFTPDLETWEL